MSRLRKQTVDKLNTEIEGQIGQTWTGALTLAVLIVLCFAGMVAFSPALTGQQKSDEFFRLILAFVNGLMFMVAYKSYPKHRAAAWLRLSPAEQEDHPWEDWKNQLKGRFWLQAPLILLSAYPIFYVMSRVVVIRASGSGFALTDSQALLATAIGLLIGAGAYALAVTNADW